MSGISNFQVGDKIIIHRLYEHSPVLKDLDYNKVHVVADTDNYNVVLEGHENIRYNKAYFTLIKPLTSNVAGVTTVARFKKGDKVELDISKFRSDLVKKVNIDKVYTIKQVVFDYLIELEEIPNDSFNQAFFKLAVPLTVPTLENTYPNLVEMDSTYEEICGKTASTQMLNDYRRRLNAGGNVSEFLIRIKIGTRWLFCADKEKTGVNFVVNSSQAKKFSPRQAYKELINNWDIQLFHEKNGFVIDERGNELL